MRIGYANLEYVGNNKYKPKEAAPFHRSKNRQESKRTSSYLRSPRLTACGVYMTSGREYSATVEEAWNPHKDRPERTPEELAFRFLAGMKDIPDWAYEGRPCKKCWPSDKVTHSCPTCGSAVTV